MLKRHDRGLKWVTAALTALALWARAPAARADCEAAARAELKTMTNVQRATFQGLNGPVKELLRAECASDKACLVVAFREGAKAAPAPNLPEGFTDSDKSWRPVGVAAAAGDCKNLYSYAFEKAAATRETKPEAAKGKGDAAKPAPAALDAIRSANTAQAALDALKNIPAREISLKAAGSAQVDVTDAAAETLQILGQIVVDRASAKGYALLQDRLKTALDCKDGTTTKFPGTCAVLDSLRIQDIAMAPQALADALRLDLLKLLASSTAAVAPAAPGEAEPPLAAGGAGTVTATVPAASAAAPATDSSEKVLADALYALAVSLLSKSSTGQDLAVKRAIRALVDYAASQPTIVGLPPAREAAVMGTLAFARCLADGDGSSSSLENCDVEGELLKLKPSDVAQPAALALAQQLVTVAAAPKTTVDRLHLALDTVAETACMVLRAEAKPSLECPAIESITLLDATAKVAFGVAFADAALDKSPGRFTVVASKLVDLVWAADDSARQDKRHALRLLAGVLDYGATYAAATTDDGKAPTSEQLHEQRTKILESLTDDMTNRAGRGGDCILSFGGALRAAGGMRFGTKAKGSTLFGPVGLPLGLAFTQVPRAADGWGFHLQLDAVDLGNYLALDNGPKVKKPELGDVFAPGLTIGAGYGQTLPVVVAATASYTPQFQLDPDKPDERGSINVGLTLGIHVPLIDLN